MGAKYSAPIYYAPELGCCPSTQPVYPAQSGCGATPMYSTPPPYGAPPMYSMPPSYPAQSMYSMQPYSVPSQGMTPGYDGTVYDSVNNVLYVPDALTATALDGRDGKYDMKVNGTKIKVMKKKNGLPVYPGKPMQYGYPTPLKKDPYVLAGVGPCGSVYDVHKDVLLVPDDATKTLLDSADGHIDGTYNGTKIRVKRPKNMPKKMKYSCGIPGRSCSPGFGYPVGPATYSSPSPPAVGGSCAGSTYNRFPTPMYTTSPCSGNYTTYVPPPQPPANYSSSYYGGCSSGPAMGYGASSFVAPTYVSTSPCGCAPAPTYRNMSLAETYNRYQTSATYVNAGSAGASVAHQSYGVPPAYESGTWANRATSLTAPIVSGFKALFSDPNPCDPCASMNAAGAGSASATSHSQQANVGHQVVAGPPTPRDQPAPPASYEVPAGMDTRPFVPDTRISSAPSYGASFTGTSQSGSAIYNYPAPAAPHGSLVEAYNSAANSAARAPRPSYTTQAPTNTYGAPSAASYGSYSPRLNYASQVPHMPSPCEPCQPTSVIPYF